MNFFFRQIYSICLAFILITHVQANPNDKLYQKLDLFSDVLDTLKKEYVDDVKQDEVIDSAINGMLQSLDPYSSYMSPEAFQNMNRDTKGEFGGLGIEITMESGLVKIITPIEGTPADKAGVQAGDYIVKIGNKQVKGMTLLDAVKLMRGKVGTSLEITVRRPEVENEIKFIITRAVIKIREVSAEVKDGIGYIRLRAFNEQSHSQLIKQLKKISNKKVEGYILDLRNNPGGLLSQAIKVTETFLDGGEVVSTRGRDKNDIRIFNAKKGDEINNKPLIILINQGSASASEIVSGALKDHKRAILLGEKSFGKGSVQSIIPLKNRGGLRLTTAKYYLPSGESIHEKGVEPDITVKRNKNDFKINTKTDNQLNYALNLLKAS